MTYGEYYYHIKYAINLENGKWVTSKPTMTIPKQMSKKEALLYYNAKFRKYWDNVSKK